MKRSPLLFFIILCLALTACGRGQQINGHTARTAYRSVKTIKERLPPDNKVEFEVSFWTIRDANSSEDVFLDAVDGKSPWEIIDMAKEIYQQRKTTGFKGYEKYSSWEEMIAQFDKERIEQEHRKGSTKQDESRKNGTILYDLRTPNR
ncbi:hypothetical protein [Methyloglobulus sp.]|uniref:hypothetical protein n=1 Tax=Methyloglobulus sp. TaxID=2518622 RepID=UPI0039897FBE